ncbi:hypothetical protein B0H12DRAFT_1099609 [Mycena haematopus]|nr:hypothetical protein B0H12DRAFT_1099609 [Mycena haematopus]
MKKAGELLTKPLSVQTARLLQRCMMAHSFVSFIIYHLNQCIRDSASKPRSLPRQTSPNAPSSSLPLQPSRPPPSILPGLEPATRIRGWLPKKNGQTGTKYVLGVCVVILPAVEFHSNLFRCIRSKMFRPAWLAMDL